MASWIKGITVGRGGDTSGMEKSFATVNNSIKKHQSQLRDVNSLLKDLKFLFWLRKCTKITMETTGNIC